MVILVSMSRNFFFYNEPAENLKMSNSYALYFSVSLVTEAEER